MLELKGISKSFRNGDARREVLNDLNLTINQGDLISITGPSGSGKTTLLNICGGLETPDSGQILSNGRPLYGENLSNPAEYRNKNIGFMFQEHYLLDSLTVLENILLPAMVKGRCTDDDKSRAMELIEELGLSDQICSFPDRMSGGEKQRVAVARALINNPGILLCDEPTGSLDEENGDKLLGLLLRTAKNNDSAVILVTHSQAAASRLERRYELNFGKLDERVYL